MTFSDYIYPTWFRAGCESSRFGLELGDLFLTGIRTKS